MYLFFEEGHLHPACISNRSPGMRLQAGFDAAPDLMLCVPYLATSSTKGWMYFLNSSLRVEIDTPLLAWKYSPDLDLTIRRTSGNDGLDCEKTLIIRSVMETGHVDFPDLTRPRGVTFPILVIFSLGDINRHVVSLNGHILKAKTINFINTKKTHKNQLTIRTKNEEWQENYLKHKNQQLPAPYLRIKALFRANRTRQFPFSALKRRFHKGMIDRTYF